MAGTAIEPELRARGLKYDGRVEDMRARLLAWLESEERGEQRVRTQQQRVDELQTRSVDELLECIRARGLLARVGEPFGGMRKEQLIEILAAFSSTPREFVIESDQLGWERVPADFEVSPLPPFPNSVGPVPPFDDDLSELDCLLLLFRIPEHLRAKLGGHDDLFDLMVRGGWLLGCCIEHSPLSSLYAQGV
jgi:hypothetical protein